MVVMSPSCPQRPFPMVRNDMSKKNQLRVRRVVHVPLREVSGICLHRSDNNRMFLIAISDRAAKIAWFSMSARRRRRRPNRLAYAQHCEALRFDASQASPSNRGGLRRRRRAHFAAPGNTSEGRAHRPQGVRGGCVDRSCGGRERQNCASVVRPEGVARRRSGATAQRAFARRQREKAGGAH